MHSEYMLISDIENRFNEVNTNISKLSETITGNNGYKVSVSSNSYTIGDIGFTPSYIIIYSGSTMEVTAYSKQEGLSYDNYFVRGSSACTFTSDTTVAKGGSASCQTQISSASTFGSGYTITCICTVSFNGSIITTSLSYSDNITRDDKSTTAHSTSLSLSVGIFG